MYDLAPFVSEAFEYIIPFFGKNLLESEDRRMKRVLVLIFMMVLSVSFSSCSDSSQDVEVVPRLNEDVQTDEASLIPDTEKETEEQSMTEHYTTNTKIEDVINDPVFGDYGRLIFSVDSGYYGGSTLGNLSLTWYNYIDSDKTVEICNYMRNQAENGDTIFYDIYTEEEKAADPAKRDTGLLFFKGNPGTKFAIVNAGGGFAYVGAMHDSFPHALELSKMGYNAFALIYRPGAQTACKDLSRAIAFIYRHADELQVDMDGYSLWGGSAGGRMADWVGTYGSERKPIRLLRLSS